MTPSDEQCVQGCLNGHPEAFRHLVERYQAPLTRCLAARLRDKDEAEEAAQETFVRAYFALRRLQKPTAFFSWIFGIADRVVKESRRATRRAGQVDWDQVPEADLPDEPAPCGDTPLMEAVAALPEVYREVIVLRFHGGHSCAEIGRNLGVPLGTVTKRLSRAYALLRERMGSSALDNESEVPQ